MADPESRDANDPRDEMKELNRETRRELEREEAHDTGGVERQSPEDRAGVPPWKRPVEVRTREITRVTRQQDDSGLLRTPRGEDASRERGELPRGDEGWPEDDRG